MIILFHRPPFEANPPERISEGALSNSRVYKNSDTFAVQNTVFMESADRLSIKINAIWKRRYPLELSFDLPISEGKVLELFYNSSRKKTVTRNYLIVNPYIPVAGMPSDDVIYVGRVHFEAERILIYLRSHFADPEGVTSVVMDESESSVQAMGKYSQTASAIFSQLTAKRDFLNEVDALDSTSYLEAQVDVLTKIVLASGLADSDELKEVLLKADESGIWRSNSLEKLLDKMDDKRSFRDKQLVYYKSMP